MITGQSQGVPVAQLATELGLTYDQAQHVIRSLIEGGAMTTVRTDLDGHPMEVLTVLNQQRTRTRPTTAEPAKLNPTAKKAVREHAPATAERLGCSLPAAEWWTAVHIENTRYRALPGVTEYDALAALRNTLSTAIAAGDPRAIEIQAGLIHQGLTDCQDSMEQAEAADGDPLMAAAAWLTEVPA